MFVFATMHNDHYSDLANITFQNKKEYCKLYGYPLIAKTDNWKNIPIGFEKAYLIQDIFSEYPEYEWVFFSECDTLITNMNIKLEDIVKDEPQHFVITSDINGCNAGSFFVRNSIQGREIISEMINSIGHNINEQFFIHDFVSGKTFLDIHIFSIYEQTTFNSYPKEYDIYNGCGRWSEGDFMIHMPGLSNETRINLMKEYRERIIPKQSLSNSVSFDGNIGELA
jgi:mannan polymerase II complex MNN10 subunit